MSKYKFGDIINVEYDLPPFDEVVIVYGIVRGQNPQMGNPYKWVTAKRQDLTKTNFSEKDIQRLQDKNQFSLMLEVTHWGPLPDEPPK